MILKKAELTNLIFEVVVRYVLLNDPLHAPRLEKPINNRVYQSLPWRAVWQHKTLVL